MKSQESMFIKDLVLIGGGHSHVFVLKNFGMNPLPGLRITVISRDIHTPYSGMLPGLIAGHYTREECHIDLRPLSIFAGARLFHNEVEGIDSERKLVLVKGRPPIRFDFLSVNIGSRPRSTHVPGASEYTLSVKPVDRFLNGWEDFQKKVNCSNGPIRVGVIGGGAGGVELALSTHFHLSENLRSLGKEPTQELDFHIVTSGKEILSTHNSGVQKKMERVIRERGIHLHKNCKVKRVGPGVLFCDPEKKISVDTIFWAVNASAPPWLAKTGLELDSKGFIRINDCLQSTSHPYIFAAGDIADSVNYPREKSGVFAVRQGPPLANNLRLAALGKKPKPFVPQKNFLSLISTGDQFAIASRGNWCAEGKILWKWKDHIDRKFMAKFKKLPEMTQEVQEEKSDDRKQSLLDITAPVMRCGGCGAKVGSSVLSRVIHRLSPIEREDVIIGLKDPDDAAVISIPQNKVVVQSVDYFRSFINDPYLFGKIASNHSLSDLFAMGAQPQSALAIATLPYSAEEILEDTLFHLMSGAVEVLNECNASLTGGHSSEGSELAFGLSVTGLSEEKNIMTKGNMQPGDLLILTKPLGTGTLFAADMRKKAKGHWIGSALDSMLLSNQKGAECLLRHQSLSCTDVTGFGLLGHLLEMARASKVDIEINLNQLPILPGALETIQMGIFSSLQPENVRLRRMIHKQDKASQHDIYPLLFDPQTSGGLVASLPLQKAEDCLKELHRQGYPLSCIIGQVLPHEVEGKFIRLEP